MQQFWSAFFTVLGGVTAFGFCMVVVCVIVLAGDAIKQIGASRRARRKPFAMTE